MKKADKRQAIVNSEINLLNCQRTKLIPKNKQNCNDRYCPSQIACPLKGIAPENNTMNIDIIVNMTNFFIVSIEGEPKPTPNFFTYGYCADTFVPEALPQPTIAGLEPKPTATSDEIFRTPSESTHR